MGELTGKVALVTGTAQGIGTAIANGLEEDGAKVHRVDRDTADLTDPAQVAKLIARLGHIDVLVAPVGGGDALAPSAATKLVNALSPAIVIPVRYRSPASPGSGEYEPVDIFAREMGLPDDGYQALPKLNLNGAMTGSDDSRVVILELRGGV